MGPGNQASVYPCSGLLQTARQAGTRNCRLSRGLPVACHALRPGALPEPNVRAGNANAGRMVCVRGKVRPHELGVRRSACGLATIGSPTVLVRRDWRSRLVDRDRLDHRREGLQRRRPRRRCRTAREPSRWPRCPGRRMSCPHGPAPAKSFPSARWRRPPRQRIDTGDRLDLGDIDCSGQETGQSGACTWRECTIIRGSVRNVPQTGGGPRPGCE